MKKMKICITCSAGGHLQEILDIFPFEMVDAYLVTFESLFIEKNSYFYKIYFVDDASKNLYRLLRCALQSLFIILNERPAAIVSTGAGVSLPTIFFAWLLQIKIIFIEISCQIFNPSKTGRIAYWFAKRFYVQHAALKKYYPKSVLIPRYE